jgi:hypothetical protein
VVEAIPPPPPAHDGGAMADTHGSSGGGGGGGGDDPSLPVGAAVRGAATGEEEEQEGGASCGRYAVGWSERRPFPARLLSCGRVTPPGHWQDTRLVELDISASDMRHAPGDVLSMLPRNADDVRVTAVVGAPCLRFAGDWRRFGLPRRLVDNRVWHGRWAGHSAA